MRNALVLIALLPPWVSISGASNNLPQQQMASPISQHGEVFLQTGLTGFTGLELGVPGLSQMVNPVNLVKPVLTTAAA